MTQPTHQPTVPAQAPAACWPLAAGGAPSLQPTAPKQATGAGRPPTPPGPSLPRPIHDRARPSVIVPGPGALLREHRVRPPLGPWVFGRRPDPLPLSRRAPPRTAMANRTQTVLCAPASIYKSHASPRRSTVSITASPTDPTPPRLLPTGAVPTHPDAPRAARPPRRAPQPTQGPRP